MTNETYETFTKAAEIIRRSGLSQGVYTDSEGRYCTIGALIAAKSGGNDQLAFFGRYEIVAREISILADLLDGPAPTTDDRIGAPGFAVVSRWSDDPDRTTEEVADFLSFAAGVTEAAHLISKGTA